MESVQHVMLVLFFPTDNASSRQDQIQTVLNKTTWENVLNVEDSTNLKMAIVFLPERILSVSQDPVNVEPVNVSNAEKDISLIATESVLLSDKTVRNTTKLTEAVHRAKMVSN